MAARGVRDAEGQADLFGAAPPPPKPRPPRRAAATSTPPGTGPQTPEPAPSAAVPPPAAAPVPVPVPDPAPPEDPLTAAARLSPSELEELPVLLSDERLARLMAAGARQLRRRMSRAGRGGPPASLRRALADIAAHLGNLDADD